MARIGPTRLPRPFYEPGMDDDLIKAMQLVHERRHLNCKRYDTCLDQAASGAWQGFECVPCHLFVKPEDREEDAEIIKEMFLEAMRSRRSLWDGWW